MHRSMSLIATSAAMATATALVGSPAQAASPLGESYELRKAVRGEQIRQHLKALQIVADNNNGTRASGTSGYTESVAYVAEKLRAAGYQVTVQEFPFLFFQENSPAELQRMSPSPTSFVLGTDFVTMEFSGSGEVTGELVPIDVVEPPGATPGSTSGCEASDFPAAPTEPAVALLQRGTCTFFTKADNAQKAGYDAAIIYNEGQEGRTDVLNGTLGGPVGIPVLGATYALGQALLLQDLATPVTVRVKTDTVSEERTSHNVIADTVQGRADRTVVVGAHLDSVLEGPGLQDNGSGSATLLEIAEQMSRLGISPTNRVRFAFWGAEESGLVGSEHYVATLPQDELDDIALNLNFDMIASPNYVRFVYDGDGSATGIAGPAGSAEIEQVFTDYFDAKGLPSEPTEFSGRSDYGPFIAEGIDIPAGGLFTGAEGVKTAEQAAIYGGVAGAAYDPCYHQACDVYSDYRQQQTEGFDAALYASLEQAYGDDRLAGNVNTKALNEMADAAAHAILYFAMTTSVVGEGGGAEARTFARAAGASGFSMAAADYKGGRLQR